MKDADGRHVPDHHVQLLEAFHSIQGEASEALGWASLDTKFERFVTAAISTALNRTARKRIAHIEFSSGASRILHGPKESRIDLVILEDRLPSRTNRHLNARACKIRMRYETKAGQLFDFAPQMKTKPKYLGVDLNSDMAGMERTHGAGLFFISEIQDPTRFLKPYYFGHNTSIETASMRLEENITLGTLVAHEMMNCGSVDETSVMIHMFVFDPLIRLPTNGQQILDPCL